MAAGGRMTAGAVTAAAATNPLAAAAALVGFVLVAAGAFGGHALESRVAPEAIETWRTGVFYGLTHTVAAFVAALGAASRPRLRLAATLWLIGAVMFAGSLFALTLGAPRPVGAVTPFGGLALLAGWGAAARAALSASVEGG